MLNERLIVVRHGTLRAVTAEEIRRNVGRRYVAPLIVASLIAAAQFALLRPSAETDKASRATLEPTINAPAFVRPPKPSPDALIGRVVRIAKSAAERNVV
jgi:hypothetical protein